MYIIDMEKSVVSTYCYCQWQGISLAVMLLANKTVCCRLSEWKVNYDGEFLQYRTNLSSVVVYAELTKLQDILFECITQIFTCALQCLRQVSSALLSVGL